jgi:hypothetical protein
VLNAHRGECMNCAIYTFSHGKKWRLGDCYYCGKKLVPIGDRRENGADHNDWDSRKYHKICWRDFSNREGF